MKKAGILAKRYAKALFLIGKERNILDDVNRDLSVFAKASLMFISRFTVFVKNYTHSYG